jgi:hypothetical protein
VRGARRSASAYELLELLDPLMCGHGWCVPLGAGEAELDPVDVDVVDDGVDDTEVVVVPCVEVVVAEPPVAASATPVTPALRPPAITAVMISRLILAPVLKAISLLLSRRAADGSPYQEAACATGLAHRRVPVLSRF